MKATHIEEWRPIPGWEDRYEVSSEGRVRSLDTFVTNQFGVTWCRCGKVRALWTDPKGYAHATLYRGNQGQRYAVHVLVMAAFVGERPEGAHVCHNDGNPSNNHLTNLRYDTASANQLDRALHGTSARGERNNKNRWTRQQVKQMRDLYASGRFNQREIGEMFGLRQAAVSSIVNRKTWAWLD